jgi:RNA polymerase sigma-70 factor (ECF subfamily)
MTIDRSPSRSEGMDEVVKRARTDRDAVGQLFDHFYPAIFAYCLRRLLVRALAEDVTSEVFLKVARCIGEFSGVSAEDFRRWLFRIATNEINAHLRQSIRRRQLLQAAAQMGIINASVTKPLMASDSTIDWEEIYQALSELSDREQSVISLRYFAGLKHSEIADALQIEPGTARVALSRALDRLRDRLRGSEVTRRPAPGKRGGN